jgi:hypothetical protein
MVQNSDANWTYQSTSIVKWRPCWSAIKPVCITFSRLSLLSKNDKHWFLNWWKILLLYSSHLTLGVPNGLDIQLGTNSFLAPSSQESLLPQYFPCHAFEQFFQHQYMQSTLPSIPGHPLAAFSPINLIDSCSFRARRYVGPKTRIITLQNLRTDSMVVSSPMRRNSST